MTNENGTTTNNGAAVPNATPTQVQVVQLDSYLAKPPGPYIPGTSWAYWKRMFENFLAIRGVTDENIKKLVLTSEIGQVANTALEGLLHGATPESKSYSELIQILQGHYTPKVLVLAERYKLLQLQQREGQSLSEYYAELSQAARNCKFSSVTDFEDCMVRMAFVKGIKNNATRMRLLEKEEEGTSSGLLTMAQAFEVAQNQASNLAGTGSGPAKMIGKIDRGHPHNGKPAFDKKKNPGSHGQGNTPKYNGKPQSYGGRPMNKFQGNEKPGAPRKCFNCGRAGHFKNECRSKPRNTHALGLEEYYDDDDLGIFQVRQPGKAKAIPAPLITVVTQGQPIQYELDTGAALSIIDRPTWVKLGKPALSKVPYVASAYNGTPITFRGICQVSVSLDSTRTLFNLHVLDNASSKLPILGRDMIDALKMDMGPFYKGAIRVDELSQTKTVELHLEEVLRKNTDLFRPELGRFNRRQAELKFKEDKPGPVFRRARPVPHALRPKIEATLEKLIEQKVVTPIEHSEWASPLVIVPKPGGKLRICADFKQTLNPLLDINIYPLPKPDDLFQMLNGGDKYSKVDLKDAYLQMELGDEAKKYLVINTHKGLLRYERLPFGLASAPAIFQKSMEELLAGIEGVVIYLDDVTITAPTDAEHLVRLAKVLERFRLAGLRLKQEKCEFLKEQIEFLGHLVNKRGIRPNPEKVKAILEMPSPKDLKQVESFLGMVQYYGKFIPLLSATANPLNHLRKKGVEFVWGKVQQEAFQKLKDRLVQADRLTHYDPAMPIVLATDASDYGLGAVIYHRYPDGNERAIGFASRSLTKEEKNYAQIEKEGLGIIFGVEKFNQFLYGRRFLLLTDHQPLVRIFGPKHEIPIVAQRRLTRWEVRLMEYTFDIEYRNTLEFGNADGLSRLPLLSSKPTVDRIREEMTVKVLNQEGLTKLAITVEEWVQATKNDPLLNPVMEVLRTKKGLKSLQNKEMKPYQDRQEELSIVDGCLHWEHRVVVPKSLQLRILKMLHENHFGQERMKSLARSRFWFPNMDKMIELMAKACETCALMGKKPTKVPLHSWEKAEKPWQRLHIDFCGPFHGFMWLVIVDSKTKWPEMLKMRTTTSVATINRLRDVFAIHGFPEQIVSDNGPQLASREFKEFCAYYGIHHILTPPYHANSNGQAERYVQTLKTAVEKCSYGTPSDLDTVVRRILFEYRATPHPATKMSPAMALMGRELRSRLDTQIPWQRTNISTEPQRSSYDRNAQKNHDKVSKERTFRIGDEVYVYDTNGGPLYWLPGIITQRLGDRVYMVNMGRHEKKVHANHLKLKATTMAYEQLRKEYGNTDIRSRDKVIEATKNTVTKDAVIHPRETNIPQKDGAQPRERNSEPRNGEENNREMGLGGRPIRKRQATERYAEYQRTQIKRQRLAH